MQQHHIITVGISLLTNFAREHTCQPEDALRRNVELKAYLQENPAKASAELNALNSRTGFLKNRPRALA